MGKIMRLLQSRTFVLIIYVEVVTHRKSQLLRVGHQHGVTGHLKVQSLTSEWALTHGTARALERKDKEKVGCPAHPQASQAGWNFCPHQLFTNHLR